jgi:hypothetical protein
LTLSPAAARDFATGKKTYCNNDPRHKRNNEEYDPVQPVAQRLLTMANQYKVSPTVIVHRCEILFKSKNPANAEAAQVVKRMMSKTEGGCRPY